MTVIKAGYFIVFSLGALASVLGKDILHILRSLYIQVSLKLLAILGRYREPEL